MGVVIGAAARFWGFYAVLGARQKEKAGKKSQKRNKNGDTIFSGFKIV